MPTAAAVLAAVAFIVALTISLPASAGAKSQVTRAHATRAHASNSACPWVGSNQPIARRVAQVMSHMTVADEDFLVEGHGTTNEGPNPSPNPYVFWMPGLPTSSAGAPLCIPALGEEDGPAGVADALTGVTQLPAGVDLAATFDPSLARQYGQVIGQEEFGKGAAVNLGPTVNIDRDPRWGRSFEAFTEDPFLNSSLAVGEIDGVQSTGEMSQVKHFAVYNQETNRNTTNDDVLVSARTMHEIYFPAFEAAVKQANSASAMCSYAVLAGDFACQSRFLLTNVLKEEWDFPGFVTSDYGALHSTAGGAFAGLDQEQPFNTYFGQPLEDAVNNGTIPQSILNTMVQRMLTQMFRFGLFDHPLTPTPTATVTTAAHQALGNQVADSGTTLLKNQGHTLPLTATNAGTVAVIGPSASASPTYGGGGSAYVVPSQTVTPLQGIQSAAGSGTSVTYTQGLPTDSSLPTIPSSALSPAYPSGGTPFGGTYNGTLTAPETGTYVLAVTNPCGCYTPTYLSLDGKQILDDPSTPPVHVYSVAVDLTAGQTYQVQITGASSNLAWATPSDLAPGITAAANAAKSAASAVVVVSDDTETEAADRLSLNLPSAQDELISAVAGANPHTTVVINAGAPVAMPWLGQVAAVVDAWYPGQSSGTSLADVLFGKVDPSGHLPVTFPTSLSQVPASTPAQFPGVNGEVEYSEGLEVGYRWYDANHVTPLFPFGFGLSYTRFSYSDLRVRPGATNGVRDVQVTARVTNVGNRAGADVAQLYLGDPRTAGEPPRQLVGFQRVSLDPGESARVQFTITPRDTWWWDQNANGWDQSTGRYAVYVGDSSALSDLPLRNAFDINSTPGARQVVVNAPRTMQPGKTAKVRVRLTKGGDETLRNVQISLQLPEGWTAQPLGQTSFRRLAADQAATVKFAVTPPSWAPSTNSVVHGTADLGPDAQREDGVTVAVG
ncbi:MAG TPA: glycoside hydrolase family 3 C-terminal domain-containing protein [Solirubrobacteraceae bacterium]|nr:glycoside hydrolase family 3 C-terminal domain-containing protein [Solirubrobacteraceae bacterium]